MSDDTRLIKRREALRTGLRLGGLGGLVALVAGIRLRNGGCTNASPCQGCPAFVDCGLPKAERLGNETGSEVDHGG